ncbi:MAG: hypothetical protein Kow00121_15530 [Elainellaceae cyanobacterium]
MSKTEKRNPVSVQVFVARLPKRRSQSKWKAQLITLACLLFAASLVVGGIRLALQVMVNPGAVQWLSWVIPGWDQLPLSRQAPQTLEQIRADAAKADLRMGQPVYLSTYPGFSKNTPGFNDFVLPLYKPHSPCAAETATPCEQLIEVRVYRLSTASRLLGQATAYEQIDRITNQGPEELMAIAPLMDAGIVRSGSSRRLPLTTLTFIEGNAPMSGAWLHLSGAWQRGSTRLLYGQVVRYDPQQGRLQPLQAWTSPAEEFPKWKSITGDAATELVVNQTLGLEPEFQVYQFKGRNVPGNSMQVQPVSLTQAVLDHPSYRYGLLLARNRLWSPALQLLQKSRAESQAWSAAAQAQLDFVELHAQVTRAQAARDWASPRQEVVALLIDGQWKAALEVLKTAHQNGYSTAALLTDQSERLWQRVEAAVRIPLHRTDVLRWGALLAAVRQDREAAFTWLQKQANTNSPAVSEVLALLDPLPATIATSPNSTTATDVAPVITSEPAPIRHLIGSALPVSAIDPDSWQPLEPTDSLMLEPQQTWYEVQVLQVQDGQDWSGSPVTEISTAAAQAQQPLSDLLALGDLTLQLITWSSTNQPQVNLVTVRAIQLNNGELRLLATGDRTAASTANSRLLAIASPSLNWLEPIVTLTLADFNQQEAASVVLPVLWQELQQSGYLSPSIATPTAMLGEFSNWSVQQIELTGDSDPEAILTFQTKPTAVSEVTTRAIADSSSALKTLILSSQGTVLYSDLQMTNQTLRAIANLGDDSLPVLIIDDAQSYRVERWSEQSQQFE